MNGLGEIALLGIWAAQWALGGWLLAASLFRLRRTESAMVGLGLGLSLQPWLANVMAHAMPVPVSFWASAALILVAGSISALAFRKSLHLRPSAGQWLILVVLTLLFNAIGRGLGIFDDYQNLPTISLMAAGDIPPHFALNPALNFGYHYLLLLFSAEVMRLGGAFPWSALDLARGLFLALPLILAGMWAYRLTGSRLAAFLTGCMLAFSGGSRWLLLLLPPSWLQHISGHIMLIGSAATSAPNLATAMVGNWKIDGAGPLPFPFAFYTGVNPPYIMAYTGIASSGALIMLLLLLTAQRWRHRSAALVSAALIGSLAIANEIAFLLLGLGFVIVVGVTAATGPKAKLRRDVWLWIGITGIAVLIAVLQGGMLTEIAGTLLGGARAMSSYFDTTPIVVWPPSIVSAHLGSLSILDPSQLAAGLAEIGPVILLTPLVIAWGWKSLRVGNWFESSLIAGSTGTLIALFVAFKGPLFTATPRLMGDWFFVCTLYAVPLVWIWARKRADSWKIGAVTGGLAATLGGLVLFGVQLAAIQRPVYATFITPMDAKMSAEYWNKLREGAWVFDPVPFRAPTVFGRFTDSSPSWYTRSPAWQSLTDAPDPQKLRAAGFAYAYFDSDYWSGLTPAAQSLFLAPCVKQVGQVNGIHSEKDYTKDFRRLIDLTSCN